MTDILQWLQVATFLVVAATLIVYWKQLRALQEQVTAAREASKTQNFLTLVDYIHRPEHRKARRILQGLGTKPLSEWTTEERVDAEMACSAWDTVGLVLRNTSIPNATELIIGNWRHSIYRCHTNVRELIAELRESRDPDFWDDFEWLANRALDGFIAIDGKLRPKHG